MAYWVTGSLTPFDDQRAIHARVEFSSSNPAMDTTAFDGYRQGVEMRRTQDIYTSTQPKVWGGTITTSGTITHEQDFRTFGQAVSFAEFFAKQSFEEKPPWNPVAYIAMGDSYPLPIIANYGPQEQQEAIIEPLTFPQRLNSNEGLDVAHAVKGEMEDGNHLDGRLAGNSRVEQFVDYDRPLAVRPWLDEGVDRFGDTITGSVHHPGFVAREQRKKRPFVDQTNDYILSQITSSTDTTMYNALKALQLGRGYETDMRPRGQRSTPAGFTNSPTRESARTGTDSIAFIGRKRGS